jgi:dihydrofolate reductase
VKIAIIAAVALNRGIGKDGRLPWHLPEDLRHFKQLTMGHVVLMGKNTWDSLGKPLPGRRNVVLARTLLDDVESYLSIDAALNALHREERIFVIGGGEVYAQLLPRADELYLTVVEREVDADTFFPAYASLLETGFILRRSEPRDGFRFEEYTRSA